MGTDTQKNMPARETFIRVSRCVLCGVSEGGVQFKGRVICRHCLERAKRMG
jgi:ribosomal protein S14